MQRSGNEKPPLDFIMAVESMVVDISQSVLIDAELHQYRQSLIIASLFSAALEVKLNDMITRLKKAD